MVAVNLQNINFRIFMLNRLLIFFLLLFIFKSSAQSLRFEHYNEANGLSHNAVRQIIQDKTGFLWVGTFGGLNRFDGFQFKSYLSNDFPINDDDITAMVLDEESDNLWIGTRNGLTLFQMQTNTFKTFLPEENNPNSIPDAEIRSIYVDSFKRVWIGTKTQGVVIYNPKENTFRRIAIEGFNYIKSIVGDSEGKIWIGSYNTGGIAHISLDKLGEVSNLKTYSLEITNSEEINPYVNFIYEDDKSDIFIGTRKGLYKKNKTTDIFEHLIIENESVKKSIGPYFICVTQAPDGKYWLGTLGGILVCEELDDISKGNYDWHYSVSSDTFSLVDDIVSKLFFDYNGVLWIGTENGLDKYDPYENQFVHINNISSSKSNKTSRVSGIAETYDDKLIVAVRHNGLFISDEGNFKLLSDKHNDISSIYSFDGKTFYCGLWNGDVLIYDYTKNTNKIINIGFEDVPIFTFCKLSSNNIIVGSFGQGAVEINAKGKVVSEKIKSLIPNFDVNKMVSDTNNNIWMATEQGIVKYNFLDEKITIFQANKTIEPIGLSNNNVSDIAIGLHGEIWASTRAGLNYFDSEENDFKRLINSDLSKSWITDILIDGSGSLWLNFHTNKVAKYNTNTFELESYYVESGNKLDIFSFRGFYLFNDSRIYMGSKNGIIYFSTEALKNKSKSFSPFISELQIQNKEILVGQKVEGQLILDEDINFSKSIELEYVNRNFSFLFSSSSYIKERYNKFMYKLEGYDENWYTADITQRKTQYTNLFFGDYIFKIKTANSYGDWSEVSSYNVTILPPVWLSYEAILLYIVVSFMLFYVVRKISKRQLKLKEDLLMEKIKHERDDKLNNEKLRFFTNISHELRTPLTLILGPVKQLLEQGEGSKYQQSRFSLIHQNANRLLNLVNQVLDFRKAQTGELKLKVTKSEILYSVRSVFNSFVELANEKHISFHLICEHESIQGWVDLDKLDKILYNLLSNALKFTPNYGNIDLFIGINESGQKIIIEVSDDGIGIPLESQEKIFTRFYQAKNSKENNTGSGIGLALVNAIVKIHKGEISLKSSPENGSVFSIELPIDKSYFEEDEIFESSSKALETQLFNYNEIKKPIQTTELKQHILVVEDNQDLRNFLADYLSDYYKVFKAENGKEGLKICKQVKPILCVVDVMMPVMDGYQFVTELKKDESISHIPIVMLTALSENEDKIKGYELGVDGYLAKPFDPTLLKTRIENIITKRIELKQKFSGEVESEIGILGHAQIDIDLILKITAIIDENISNTNLTANYLCAEIGMSSSKFYRKIKHLTDLAPNEFIRTIRLKKSAQLLKSKNYNVSEVANSVGFSDPLYFSRCFKKQFGTPPSSLLK